MRVSGAVLTALVVLGLATGVAQAYTVTHNTLGVLFSDDMEGPYFQAEVGSWGTANDGINLLAFTRMRTGAASGGPTAAVNGSDYVEVSRDATKTWWQEAIFTQPVSSGTLDIEFQYWIDNPWPTIAILDNAIGTGPPLGGNIASATWAGSTGPGGGSTTVWYDYDNSVYNGASISRAQWNLFQMHVDLDADTYQISVNGNPGNVVSTADGTIGRVGIAFQDINKKFYLDAAPGTPPPVVNPDIDTLLCSDDTYVENTAPETNFGDADSVVVKAWGGGPNRKAYVKWDISSVTEPVTSARLQLQNQWDSIIEGGQAVDVYLLNDGDVGEGWGEMGMNWNNAPASVITSSVDFDPARSTLLGQVSMLEPIRAGNLYTMLNQALIDAINNDTDGNLTLMFAIVNQGPTGMTFGSKEDTNGNANYWTVPFEEATLVLNDPDDVLPSPDIPGDANRDGYVDVSDLGILATNYDAGSGFGWEDADFTGDGLVDVSDLGILATNYGAGPTALSVPEPASVTLIVIALAFLVFYRQKR